VPLFFEGYYADDEGDKDVEEHFPELEVGGYLILDADQDPDYLVPNTSLKYPDTCHLIVRQEEIAWRIMPNSTSNRVETVDLPIALIKKIAQHEDYAAWAADRNAWVEVHGSMSLKSKLELDVTAVERDYIRERAAKELPGFVPDFLGLAQLRPTPHQIPDAIVREYAELSGHGYHGSVDTLVQPPYAVSLWQWMPCQCIVIEGYLGCEYKLIREFQTSL
jgi:hypothetical protein